MCEPMQPVSPSRAAALILALAGLAAPARASGASDLLYERTLMQAADARCHLFAADVGRALAASRDQARSAAVRAGDAPVAVADTQARAAARAASVDCRAPGLAMAAARVRAAYAGYARLQVLTFPGPQAMWRAERPYAGYHGPPRWGLVQVPLGQGGWVLFGQVDGAVTALDARRGAAPAAGARLFVRDPARLATPYIASSRRDLAAQAPPHEAARVFIADDRYAPPRSLWPAGATAATAYRFPATALQALAALDPREVATLELVYPSVKGERVVRAWIEVGDLAAARAFLSLGRPPATR